MLRQAYAQTSRSNVQGTAARKHCRCAAPRTSRCMLRVGSANLRHGGCFLSPSFGAVQRGPDARLKLQAVQASAGVEAVDSTDHAYIIPVSQNLPADAIAQAHAAAEAEQQKLMTSGPLADEIRQGNKQLATIMSSFSTLQRLYHKAVLLILQRHGQLATSQVDLAYSIYCELLGRKPDKKPGDKITNAELQQLSASLDRQPSSKLNYRMAHLADCLCQLSATETYLASDMFVLRDILRTLIGGYADTSDTGSQLLGVEKTKDPAQRLFKGMLASLFDGVNNTVISNMATQRAQKILLATCQPADQPPNPEVADRGLDLLLALCMLNANMMSPIVRAVIAMLPDSDQPSLLQATHELKDWFSATYANALALSSIAIGPESVLVAAAGSCLFSYWAATMRQIAFEQLQGSRPIGDWGWLETMFGIADMIPDAALKSWLLAQKNLVGMASGTISLSPDQMAARLESTTTAGEVGALLGIAADAVDVEMVLMFAASIPKVKAEALFKTDYFLSQVRAAVRTHTQLKLRSMSEVIDAHHSCWSSLWYWMSLVTLSLQQTGGKQGPEAVAVAEQLMKEKHSVFMARLCVQLANVLMPSHTRQPHQGLLTASQCHVAADLNHLTIARGSKQKALQLTALQQSASFLSSPGLTSIQEQAASMFAQDSKTQRDSQDVPCFQQDVSRTLANKVPVARESAERQLMYSLAMSSEGSLQPYDPALGKAYCAWGSCITAKALTHALFTKVADHIWFAAGLAQHHIHTHSSSKEVAELMLGPGATEEQYVRPLQEFVATKAATAEGLATAICNSSWSVSSSTAETLLWSELVLMATPSLTRAQASTWLAAAALSSKTVRLDLATQACLAVYICGITYRVQRHEEETQWTLLGVLLLDAVHAAVQTNHYSHLDPCSRLMAPVLGSPPFNELDAPVQAMMQAAVKRCIHSSSTSVVTDVQLDIIKRVPLLHAEDYELLLSKAFMTGDQSALSQIWSAAVSASTDPQLSVTPAFGGQRPNEEWLSRQLLQLMDQVESTADMQWRITPAIWWSDNWIGSCQVHLLLPVMKAADRLLQELTAAVESSDEHAVTPRPPGWLLLDGVCNILSLYRLPFLLTEQLQNAVVQLLASHQHLDRPKSFVSAMCAAASADISAYQLAVQQSGALKLTADDVRDIRSAAIQGAATAVIGATETDAQSLLNACDSSKVLLQLWSEVISAVQALPAAADSGAVRSLQPPAAAAVVRLLMSNTKLAEQLLQSRLPVTMLIDLLEAAVASEDGTALQLLLQHARQHDLLQELPTRMSQTTFCNMIAACSNSSTISESADDTWDLYLLLQQSCLSGAWPLTPPARPLSALLEQQGKAGQTDRVLQLWRDNIQASGAAVDALSPNAQSVLVSALVKDNQQQEAVQLVKQVPQQLGHLVTLWQQQQQQQNGCIAADLMLTALQLAIQMSNADAVDSMLGLLGQDAQGMAALQADTQATVHLVQLLSTHGNLETAQSVLKGCVLDLDQSTAAPAVAGYITAVATQAPQQQQEELVLQLFGQTQQSKMQALLSAALDHLLSEDHVLPAAVAMLLRVLTSSSGKDSQQLLPSLLTSSQFEQLCILVSKQRNTSSSSSTLPTAADLAQQCIESNADVTPTAVVTLINSIADDDSDLQPARAAELLGLLHDTSEGVADHLDASHAGNIKKSDVLATSCLIAQLCYRQLPCDLMTSTAEVQLADLSSALSWVSQLTHEAASAALFATWYWAQPTTTAAADAADIRLVVSPPPATAVVGILCVELYHAARSGQRPTVDGLLLDLGLVAAAAAQQWEEGAAVISTAERALATANSDSSGSRKGGGNRSTPAAAHWIPLLPAALTALPAVMVHTQGVTKTAELLIREHEQQQQQQPEQAASRRGKAVTAAAAVATVASSGRSDADRSLLSPACICSFFSAAVDVAAAAIASGDDDAAQSAAAEAIKVAHTLYGKQLVTVQLAATNGSSSSSSSSSSEEGIDASIYSSLLQLYGLTGQLQQVADITMTAVHGQLLPACGGNSSGSAALQQVLAGSAAALLSAGAAAVVFDLLDGLTAAGVNQVTHKQLVERLMQAAQEANPNEVQQALSCRLSGGSEAAEWFMLCSNPDEVAQEVGGGGGGGDVDSKNRKDSSRQVYLQLVAREGLEPLILKQQLQQRLKQAVQQIKQSRAY